MSWFAVRFRGSHGWCGSGLNRSEIVANILGGGGGSIAGSNICEDWRNGQTAGVRGVQHILAISINVGLRRQKCQIEHVVRVTELGIDAVDEMLDAVGGEIIPVVRIEKRNLIAIAVTT